MRVRQKQRKIQSCVFSKGAGKGGKSERNRERTVKDGATGHGFNVSEPGFLQEWSPQDFPSAEARAGTGGVGRAWSVIAIHTNQMHPHDSALIVAFFFWHYQGFVFLRLWFQDHVF